MNRIIVRQPLAQRKRHFPGATIHPGAPSTLVEDCPTRAGDRNRLSPDRDRRNANLRRGVAILRIRYGWGLLLYCSLSLPTRQVVFADAKKQTGGIDSSTPIDATRRGRLQVTVEARDYSNSAG